MKNASTLVQLLFFACFAAPTSWAGEVVLVKSSGQPEIKFSDTSAFALFFDPEKNGVTLETQKIDYDLTKETVLRLGPFLLDQSSVDLQMTREQGEYYELDFGFDLIRRTGAIYIISFRWPEEYVTDGTLEIIDERAQSLWRRKVTSQDVEEWKAILAQQNSAQVYEKSRAALKEEVKKASDKNALESLKKKFSLTRPSQLSQEHSNTVFGLAHKGFYEIPVSQSASPFRFCVSKDSDNGRIAVCSRKYKFVRQAGRYALATIPNPEPPKVLVNEKAVMPKGTAVFLDHKTPIKLAALLKNGTYFEFVSHPKEIKLVDLVFHKDKNYIEAIGFGDEPMGQINESFYADSVHWGFLNFMPTIGDLRKFWRATMRKYAPYLYLRGVGGAPFRQNFTFTSLPSEQARIVLSDQTVKSTYSSKVWVKGRVNKEVQVQATDTEVHRTGPEEFEWHFLAPTRGTYNTGTLDVIEKGNTWKASYQIFRGYPTELGIRLSGVLTTDLKLILLGEASFQHWFESLLGWHNYYLGHLRWGIAARYFEAFVGTDQNVKQLAVGNVDLKYRLTPGIWGRDPTVGLIASAMNLDYYFNFAYGSPKFSVPVAGGGVFWARSMPKFFDEIFNIIPFMRYPKWVDWEFIYYPYAFDPNQKSRYMLAMNFHGKIQWTKNFYGEGGFGLKNLSFQDTSSADLDFKLAPTLAVAYGTVGIGFNF